MIELLNNWPVKKKYKPHICWRIGKDFRRNINIRMERWHIERSSTFWRLFRPPNIIFRHVYLNQCVKTSILAFVVVKCVLFLIFVPFLPAYLKLSLFLIMKCKNKNTSDVQYLGPISRDFLCCFNQKSRGKENLK